MSRPKLYLALMVLALVIELGWSALSAPKTCLRCDKVLEKPSRELPDFCETCADELRTILAVSGPPAVERPYVLPYPVDPADPLVELETTLGPVIVELFARKAPLSTENFLHYTRRRDYDDVIFHRVEDYLCVSGRLRGGYGGVPMAITEQFPPIRHEGSNGLKNFRGTIALPRQDADPDSATSDYFFNFEDHPNYDWKGPKPAEAGYCVFGQVIQGFGSLNALRHVPLVEHSPGPGYERLPRDPQKVIRAYEVEAVPEEK